MTPRKTTTGNVPKLRFPEFRNAGAWEESFLGNHCAITTGRLDANAMIDNGQYRFYTCAKDYYFIGEYAFDTDALLISGNGANVGYIHHYNGRFNAYQRTYVLDNFIQDIIFIKYSLEQNLHKRIATEKKDGNTPYIVMSTLTEMPIKLPTLPEQQKIADCLSSIDELITAQAQKLDTLTAHKKGLMQQLFPAEGETVPKLRFPEFRDAGEWEEKQFVKLADIIDGDRGKNYPKSEDFSNSGYCVFLNAKNVTKNGFVFDEIQFIGREKDEALRKGKLKRLDIILTTRGSVGNFAFFSEEVPYENLRINSGMVILRLKSKLLDSNYFYTYTKSETITKTIENVAFGSAQPQLTVSEIQKFKIYYPEPPEQQKIADCLSSIDELITTHTQKLDTLKNHKKGLMQQLFPSTDEVSA